MTRVQGAAIREGVRAVLIIDALVALDREEVALLVRAFAGRKPSIADPGMRELIVGQVLSRSCGSSP